MNLLTDPVFRVETPEGTTRFDLPQLLDALGRDRVESLSGLQRHQEDSFHVFLCYLAGAVLAREGLEDTRQDARFWRESIQRLTIQQGCANDSAWTLVVDDVTQPAFMQVSLASRSAFDAFKLMPSPPDSLDILATAKSHDVKARRVSSPEIDDWVYALISLQTMAGFFGQGNYGIARMNGGFGSRPVVGLVSGLRYGERFSRDVKRLLAVRGALLAGPWGYIREGIVFSWISRWDLKTSIALRALDPFYIEMARALRLVEKDGAIFAKGSPSKTTRIMANETNGVMGDPWTPVNRKKPSSLTVSPRGLTPDLLRNLLFEDGFDLTAMQRPGIGREDEPCQFTASVLVRGQGTTDGFHSISVPVPAPVSSRLFRRGPERDRLAELSKTALNDAGTMQNRVLKPAFFTLLESNPDRVDGWWQQAAASFSGAWSGDFFPWLWRTVEREDREQARLEWLKSLRGKAETVLREAVERYPARDGRRYRARVNANGLFFGTLNKNFPELKEAHYDAPRNG